MVVGDGETLKERKLGECAPRHGAAQPLVSFRNARDRRAREIEAAQRFEVSDRCGQRPNEDGGVVAPPPWDGEVVDVETNRLDSPLLVAAHSLPGLQVFTPWKGGIQALPTPRELASIIPRAVVSAVVPDGAEDGPRNAAHRVEEIAQRCALNRVHAWRLRRRRPRRLARDARDDAMRGSGQVGPWDGVDRDECAERGEDDEGDDKDHQARELRQMRSRALLIRQQDLMPLLRLALCQGGLHHQRLQRGG